MDQIKIENLEIFANHGVYPEENRLGQKFLVSCILYVDTRKAGKTDDLEASVNYGTISHLIKEKMEEFFHYTLDLKPAEPEKKPVRKTARRKTQRKS